MFLGQRKDTHHRSLQSWKSNPAPTDGQVKTKLPLTRAHHTQNTFPAPCRLPAWPQAEEICGAAMHVSLPHASLSLWASFHPYTPQILIHLCNCTSSVEACYLGHTVSICHGKCFHGPKWSLLPTWVVFQFALSLNHRSLSSSNFLLKLLPRGKWGLIKGKCLQSVSRPLNFKFSSQNKLHTWHVLPTFFFFSFFFKPWLVKELLMLILSHHSSEPPSALNHSHSQHRPDRGFLPTGLLTSHSLSLN